MMLKEELLKAWWTLLQLPGVGRVSVNEIRQQLPYPNDLLSCTDEQLVAMGLTPEAVQRWRTDDALLQGFDTLWRWCQHPDCGVLLAGVAPYPKPLAALRDAPLILYYHGNLACLAKPMVAMVGSRKPTEYAAQWAQQTAQQLAGAGVTVVSGLALGIDGYVHQGAVQGGSTIGVLGCGLDVIYPQRHLKLAQMMLHNGLLLSEFAPGTQAQARHFPSRNRIISGLSQATVVVEAALKSGSLITARQAAEQGRDVFALPGLVHNPMSQGCHQLIRDGAYLVQSAEDILQELNLAESGVTQSRAALQPEFSFDSPAAHNVRVPTHNGTVPVLTPESLPPLLTHIDFSATSADVIAIRSDMSMSDLLPALMALELEGWLTQVPGGYQRLK